MFCPDCGTKNMEGAKFCINCGMKLFIPENNKTGDYLNKDRQEESTSFSILQNKYRDMILVKITEAYLNDEDIEVSDFYKKAELHDLKEQQVNEIVKECRTKIEKINTYIKKIFSERLTFEIYDEDVEELDEFIQVLGLNAEGEDFIDKYEEDHDIPKKREFSEEVLQKYCTSGVIPDFSTENGEDENIYNSIRDSILKYEDEIKKFCNDEIDFKDDSALEDHLVSYGEKLGFSEEDADMVMSCYRRKCGVESKKLMLERQLKTEAVQRKMAEKFSPFICDFSEPNIVFDAKYFVQGDVEKNLSDLENRMLASVRNVPSGSTEALNKLKDSLALFYTESPDKIGKLVDSLGLEHYDQIHDQIQGFFQYGYQILQAAKEIFDEIDNGVEAEAAYRKARKDMRSRWEGGGFGLGGAIKGAAMAGVMNMGSGAVHSVINGLGNMSTSSKASKAKSSIIDEIKNEMSQGITSIIAAAKMIILTELRDDCSDCIWQQDYEEEADCYKTLLEWPERTGCLDQIKKLLLINPYKLDNYILACRVIERYYEGNEYRANVVALLQVATRFGIDLKEHLLDVLDNKINNVVIGKKELNLIANMESILPVTDSCDTKLFKAIVMHIHNTDEDDIDTKMDIIKEFDNDFPGKKIKEKFQKYIEEDIENAREYISAGQSEEAEAILKLLIHENKLASECNGTAIKDVLSSYVFKDLEQMELSSDISDIDFLVKYNEKAISLDKKYGCKDGEEKVKRDVDTYIVSAIASAEFSDQISGILGYIEKVSDKFGWDLNEYQKSALDKRDKMKAVYDYTVEKPIGLKKKAEPFKTFETLEEADRFRRRIKEIEAVYQAIQERDEDSIQNAVARLQAIQQETECGGDVIRELQDRLETIDIEKRTVLGVVYSSRKEAEAERKKVVGDRRFATEEEANAERERQRKEKELIEQEKNQIDSIEANEGHPILILEALKRKKFITKPAKQVVKKYEEDIIQLYNNLTAEKVQAKCASLRTKRIIAAIVGVIFLIFGIPIFIVVGLFLKIVTFFVVCIPWGIFITAKEELDQYRQSAELLSEIKKRFVIKGDKIDLK